MHKLDVAHGNLKAVCLFLHRHFIQALTFLQTNVLVDAHGHASVAGLSVAFHPSDVPRKDPNWYFRGLAPELIDPLSPRSGDPPLLPTTKDSDMYAFGVLVWDVSSRLECLICELLNGVGIFLRFLLGELHSPEWKSQVLP